MERQWDSAIVSMVDVHLGTPRQTLSACAYSIIAPIRKVPGTSSQPPWIPTSDKDKSPNQPTRQATLGGVFKGQKMHTGGGAAKPTAALAQAIQESIGSQASSTAVLQRNIVMDAGYFLRCSTNKDWVNTCMANQAFLRKCMEQREKLQSLLSNNEENNGSKESQTEMTPLPTLVNELRCNTHKIVAARALGIKQKTILVTFEGKTVPRHVRYVFEVYKVKKIKLSWKTLPDAMGSDHLPIRIELPTNGARRRDAPFIRWDTFRDTIKKAPSSLPLVHQIPTGNQGGDKYLPNLSPSLPICAKPWRGWSWRELRGSSKLKARLTAPDKPASDQAWRDDKVGDKIKLLINGQQIKSQTSIRILGITIDENGKAGSWYQQIKSHWKHALNMIKHTTGKAWGAKEDILRTMAVPPGQGSVHPVVDEDIGDDTKTRRSTQARRTSPSIDILQSVGACMPTKVAHRNRHDTGLEV
ncbi:hypothetical protein HPB47_017136 [Ixodes persulcatus]|uniref:Uncharacterized protein n=1 Tax=Ixodes persulcatus TaxID=34615 RepID=A0AC60QSN8_IXOPE|nr:hypothetical protein HPB47_017136 [Ixodes persulcatus]